MTDKDLEDLKRAKGLLENPGIAVRLTNTIGTPIEKGFDMLPKKFSGTVQGATRAALEKAVAVAVFTMKDQQDKKASNFMHKLAAATSGAAGGAFGLAALPVELPISTVIMFRSILDIAREEGESIRKPNTLVACLEVFALGGATKKDDGVDTGYYATRTALARTVSEAVEYLARQKAIDRGAPALVRLIAAVAARFGVVVSEKVAASAVPIAGAAGGAAINTIFVDHFQKMATGHFTVRRLERIYGQDAVRIAYDKF